MPINQPTTCHATRKVELFHIAEALVDPAGAPSRPKVLLKGLRPIGRLGGATYARTTEVFDMARPLVTKK